jgi:hypothetical protein
MFGRLAMKLVLLGALALTSATTDPRVAECLTYLRKNAPVGDATLSDAYLLENVKLALEARDSTRFATDVPWALFLNDVLPYAIMSEKRTSWRDQIRAKVAPMVAHATSLENATLLVAAQLWDAWGPPSIKYVAAPPDAVNTYDPLAVIAAHNASCTGLSVLFASACRSVGIPSRVAGVPHWNLGPASCPHGDADAACGNHDWNEVWFNDQWSFIDVTSSHNTFNSSWFYPSKISQQVPATLPDIHGSGGNHSVWASSFSLTPKVRFPMVWDWRYYLPGVDVTERYIHP